MSSILRRVGFHRIQKVRKAHYQVPENVNGIQNSDIFKSSIDRSRELSTGQVDIIEQQSLDFRGENTTGYDLVGNANMENMVQNYVPEPFFALNNDQNLKEGIPVGLSDAPSDRGAQRWMMDERLLNS